MVEESRLFTWMFLSGSILRGTRGCILSVGMFCLFLSYDLFIYYITIVYIADVDVFMQCCLYYIAVIHIIPLSLIITLKGNTLKLWYDILQIYTTRGPVLFFATGSVWIRVVSAFRLSDMVTYYAFTIRVIKKNNINLH